MCMGGSIVLGFANLRMCGICFGLSMVLGQTSTSLAFYDRISTILWHLGLCCEKHLGDDKYSTRDTRLAFNSGSIES
jgi:hypothetical protein